MVKQMKNAGPIQEKQSMSPSFGVNVPKIIRKRPPSTPRKSNIDTIHDGLEHVFPYIWLIEEILNQLIGSLLLKGFYTSQVVQDFFYQQYFGYL